MSRSDRARELPAPAAVRWIVATLEDAGFETWAVGGAVRDELRGEIATDWDFATRARPAQVRKAFRRTVPVGVEHGTIGVLDRYGTMHEVTTFRRDVATDGRHAVVEFADRLDDDLARRDFTINAVAWHPLRKVVHDPFGGAADLEAGVLRTVGEPADRFAEDWLRVLRALRFAGRFRLEVDPATWQALVAATPSLPRLAPERIREELLKVLGQDAEPSRALDLYRSSGALAVIAPELAALSDAAWDTTIHEVDHVPMARSELRLAALLARVGQPPVRPEDPDADAVTGLRAADEASLRAAVRAAALLTRLRASNAQLARVTGLLAAGLEPPPADLPAADLRRWLARTGPERLPDLARLWAARHRAGSLPDPTGAVRRLRGVLAERPALSTGDLTIDGRDLIRLGLRPGPAFGRILDALLDQVLEDPARNRPEILEAEALRLAGTASVERAPGVDP